MYIEDYNDSELMAQAQQLIKAQQTFSEMPLMLDVEMVSGFDRTIYIVTEDDTQENY